MDDNSYMPALPRNIREAMTEYGCTDDDIRALEAEFGPGAMNMELPVV